MTQHRTVRIWVYMKDSQNGGSTKCLVYFLEHPLDIDDLGVPLQETSIYLRVESHWIPILSENPDLSCLNSWFKPNEISIHPSSKPMFLMFLLMKSAWITFSPPEKSHVFLVKSSVFRCFWGLLVYGCRPHPARQGLPYHSPRPVESRSSFLMSLVFVYIYIYMENIMMKWDGFKIWYLNLLLWMVAKSELPVDRR